MRHTPGPWKVDSQSKYVCTEAGETIAVCQAPWHGGATGGREEGEREALANAHLIATAPELVAALADLVSALEGQAPGNATLAEALDKTRAALSKAMDGEVG